MPSAYHDATSFHWDSRLELSGAFVSQTPDYGLAVHDLRCVPDRIVLATMPEVQGLFEQLAPVEVLSRRVDTVLAASTSGAAELVTRGIANMAVCNDVGRRRQGLEWFRSRPGAKIVWMAFRSSDVPARR